MIVVVESYLFVRITNELAELGIELETSLWIGESVKVGKKAKPITLM